MVEARIAQGLVTRREISLVDVLGAAEALGDVVTGELHMDAAGVGADGAVRLEEALDLVDDVIEPAGLVPGRCGDTVDIITSMGVEQVEIPNVVGETWATAKQKLLDAGFEIDYNIFADAGPQFFTVTKLSPDGGTTADKGSVVKVSFSS